MAIDWNALKQLLSQYGTGVINSWVNPKQGLRDSLQFWRHPLSGFTQQQETPKQPVRMSPKITPNDVQTERDKYQQDLKDMSMGDLVGKLNEYQNRGNFGSKQQMAKQEAESRPNSLENQKAIDQRFGPPTPPHKPVPASTVDNNVPQEFQNKTLPETVKPPKPPTYGPSVRIQTPKEFINKPETSTTDREQLRPTTPQGEVHLPMDEGARIQTPEQFIKKPKTVKAPKPKPIDLTSLPSFPKSEPVKKGISDIDRKRFALLDTYGDTGLNSLNDDAYVERRFNAAMRGSRARQLQQNYNRQSGASQQTAARQPVQGSRISQPVQRSNPNMYRNMAQTVQLPTPRFPGKNYYRNLGLNPQQIAARDARQEANKRRRMGYRA